MTSTFETLTNGPCENCHRPRELVPLESNGENFNVCRRCATKIRVGRVA